MRGLLEVKILRDCPKSPNGAAITAFGLNLCQIIATYMRMLQLFDPNSAPKSIISPPSGDFGQSLKAEISKISGGYLLWQSINRS